MKVFFMFSKNTRVKLEYYSEANSLFFFPRIITVWHPHQWVDVRHEFWALHSKSPSLCLGKSKISVLLMAEMGLIEKLKLEPHYWTLIGLEVLRTSLIILLIFLHPWYSFRQQRGTVTKAIRKLMSHLFPAW